MDNLASAVTEDHILVPKGTMICERCGRRDSSVRTQSGVSKKYARRDIHKRWGDRIIALIAAWCDDCLPLRSETPK